MSHEDPPESVQPKNSAREAHCVGVALFVLGAIAFLPVLPCLTAAYLIIDHVRAGAMQSVGMVSGIVGLACWALSGILLNTPA